MQEFCAILDEFALPRAIIDFERHCFVAWNQRFLAQTGYSAGEIESAKLEDLLKFGESWFPLSEEEQGRTVEYVSCVAKRPFGADPSPGYVVRSQEKIGYVMLDISDSPSTQFEQGRVAGGEEERNRIRIAFHEEVSTPMVAALFMIEEAKRELEEAGLPQAEIVSKASEVLTEATEKIGQVLGESDRNPE